MWLYFRLTFVCFLGFLIAFFCYIPNASASPLLANYILGTLPSDSAPVAQLAKFNLLIISPEQAIVKADVVKKIKQLNPNIILLAYLPSESYISAWQQYPANVLYKNFFMQDSWWLKDSKGKIISNWPGSFKANMSKEWCDYIITYTQYNILSMGVWDGIFWDVVGDNASGINGGDIDLNGDGVKDSPQSIDNEWLNRVEYLLDQSNRRLGVKYILINGTSNYILQKYINGRMFETFPTPWEGDGKWATVMKNLVNIKQSNRQPQAVVLNSNTYNTGNSKDYKAMRYGLGSSLLVDNVYSSFDYGDKDHNQLWWYDEYNVNLGQPVGAAVSAGGNSVFQEDVWLRNYTNGLAVVNSTNQTKDVELGAEYEKIKGTQDAIINDGSIVDSIKLSAKDGLIMLKSIQSQPVDNLVFTNGSFLRFFDMNGNKTRNGFFAFEDGLAGGVKIYRGDLDNVSGYEKIIIDSYKFMIFNDSGGVWKDDYPFSGNFTGEMNLAVDKLYGEDKKEILLSGSYGGYLMQYNYYGQTIKGNFFPYGSKDKSGFSVAIGNLDGGQFKEAIIGGKRNGQAEVLIYNMKLAKLKKTIYLGYNINSVRVASGDVNGDKKDELIVGLNYNNKAVVRVYDFYGNKLSEFTVPSSFGSVNIDVGALDVNYDGKADIVVMTK